MRFPQGGVGRQLARYAETHPWPLPRGDLSRVKLVRVLL